MKVVCSKWTKPLVFILYLFFSSSLYAIGFGQVKVYSFLNEPLSAEIKLFGADDYPSSRILASLASPDDFAKVKVARPFYLTKFEFEVIQTRDSGTYVFISSKQPVLQPMVEFLVDLHWPDGRMVKNITILLDLAPVGLVLSDREQALTQQLEIGEELTTKRYLPKHAPIEVRERLTADRLNSHVTDKILDNISSVEESANVVESRQQRVQNKPVLPASNISPTRYDVAPVEPQQSVAPVEQPQMLAVPEEYNALLQIQPEERQSIPSISADSLEQAIVAQPVITDLFAVNKDSVQQEIPSNVLNDQKVIIAQGQQEQINFDIDNTDKEIAATQSKIEKMSSDSNNMKGSTPHTLDSSMKPLKSEGVIDMIQNYVSNNLMQLIKTICIVLLVLVVFIMAIRFVKRRPGFNGGDEIDNYDVGDSEPTFDSDDDDDESYEDQDVDMDDDDNAVDDIGVEDDDLGEDVGSAPQGQVKLDLAQQYLDIGEVNSAIEVLKEVISTGLAEEIVKAKEMLDQL